MKTSHLTLIFIVSLSLVGCNSTPKVGLGPTDRDKRESFVSQQVLSTTDRIASALESLAKIESATTSSDYSVQNYNYDERLLPESWNRHVVLLENFNGDLIDFLSMLSLMSGMGEPRVDQSLSRKPIIVSIGKGKRKLISYMAEAGYQAGTFATVRPDVELNIILVERNNGT